MPFTPFHMGVALIVKPVAQRRLSVITFGLAQIGMDIEPLIGMLGDADVLHGPTHTILGALFIAALVALVAPYICRPILRRLNQEAQACRLGWLSEPEPSSMVVWASALFGTLSHIVLDAFMHADMHPFAPFSDANPLLGMVPHDEVYYWCFILGLIGALTWLISKWLIGRKLKA